jgi:hypothetical protein
MSDRIYIRRGNKADLPTLAVGEPGFALDTHELFIGASGGNVEFLSKLSGGDKVQSGTISVNVTVSNTFTLATLTFPIAFGSVPVIIVGFSSLSGNSLTRGDLAAAESLTATTAALYANCTITGTKTLHWIAIGT